MDLQTFLEIIVIIFVVYLLLRFVVSPILKIIVGIIIVLILIYLLQQMFGFNIDTILGNYGINLGINRLFVTFNWILEPLNTLANQIKNFLNLSALFKNIPHN